MFNFRVIIHRPLAHIVRSRCSSTKTRIKQWRKPNLSRRPNLGIQNRLQLLEQKDRTQEDASEIEDLESDFMDLDKMYDLNECEMEMEKHLRQHKMVGNKYFKQEAQPSFLTWAEKEQIHYLHNSDPEKWTAEKLAEGFPATEAIVKKVLKSKWRPHDANRVLKHDQAVQDNWFLLASDKLNVSPELKRHLEQFTKRKILDTSSPKITELLEGPTGPPKPKSSEFGSIITSYEALKSKNTSNEDHVLERTCSSPELPPKGESYLLPDSKSRRHVTLDLYRTLVANSGDESPDAKVMLLGQTNLGRDVEQRSSAKPIAIPTPDFHDKPPPERVRLPHKFWLRGGTFKVGDSYYDDDGTFLYRVPGIK